MRKYCFALILLYLSCSSIRATESEYLCSSHAPTITIGGHKIQTCDYPGLIQKKLSDHTWIGEYGSTAITLFLRSEKQNFIWALTTLNQGEDSNLTKNPNTHSTLMHIEFDCGRQKLRIPYYVEYAGYFGQGRKLNEIKKNFDLPWESANPQMFVVPCMLLEN